ncbi:MAG: hypothetical protein Q9221_006116 [Calogaya cf. arnoldii]
MDPARQTIALAAVGGMGKFVCEELLADDRFDVVVISRGRDPWFTSRNIPIHVSDYSHDSVLSIINDSNATALCSFLNVNDERFITIHRAFLSACIASKTCKRLMPSEYSGDVETWPDRPRFYGTTRTPFREILKAEADGVEWTCIENGWFMDYFLPKEKSYMKPVPDEFPIDLDAWTAVVRGTGDEPQAWTLAREVGKAVVALLASQTPWEPIIYVSGQWGTFNETIKTMESFYGMVPPSPPSHQETSNLPRHLTTGRPIPTTHTPASSIRDYVAANLHNDQVYAVQAAMCDELSIDGATAVPKEKTLRQREKYFKGCKFSSVEEALVMAREKGQGVM